MGCPADIVIVYDSFNSSRLSISIKKIVADFLHTNSNYITIKYAKIQFQKGTSDCGLFTVANATAICNGMDPAYLQFDQDTMREHLKKYLSRSFFLLFQLKKLKGNVLYERKNSVFSVSAE